MISILIFTLFLLMVMIGGKRGVKSFFSLCINFTLLMIAFYLIALGLNAVIVSLLFSILIALFLLYYVNGNHLKTKVSFVSVVIILLFLVCFLLFFSHQMRLGGFGYESYEEINMFSYDIHLDMIKVTDALIILGLIGAIIDSSVAISSAVYEVYQNNPHLTEKELRYSGFQIGKSILCTTTNTLLFAFLGESMTLLIWFQTSAYQWTEIINSKVFTSELVKILFSGIGCILVIPVTSILMAYALNCKKIK